MPWSFALPQAVFASPYLSTLTPVATGSTIGWLVNRTPQNPNQHPWTTTDRYDRPRHKTQIRNPKTTPPLPALLALPARLDNPLRSNRVRRIPRLNTLSRTQPLTHPNAVHRTTSAEPPLDASLLWTEEACSCRDGYCFAGWDSGGVDEGVVGVGQRGVLVVLSLRGVVGVCDVSEFWGGDFEWVEGPEDGGG